MFSQNDILRSICDVYWFILPHDKPRLCVDKQRVKNKTHGRHKQWRSVVKLSNDYHSFHNYEETDN